MEFYGYRGSNCTSDKDAIQKYLSTDRKWEIHLQWRSHFYSRKTVPNAKDLQKLGTLEIHIIRKKRKISVPCSQSKTDVGGGGDNDIILAAAFP
jgi:hypothetical protein